MSADLTNVKVAKQAECCIVGGGPAGVILALLLARQGVKTILLEAHSDFDRDFRGDTIHPSTLELMDQIGLVRKLLAIRHRRPSAATPAPIPTLCRTKSRRSISIFFPFMEVTSVSGWCTRTSPAWGISQVLSATLGHCNRVRQASQRGERKPRWEISCMNTYHIVWYVHDDDLDPRDPIDAPIFALKFSA